MTLAMFSAILFGYLFGFIGAIPAAGPISILVLSRALERKYHAAAALAAGAAIVEAAIATALFWGLGEWLAENDWLRAWGSLLASAILMVVGIACMRAQSPKAVGEENTSEDRASKKHLFLGISITALNPTLLATWTTAIAMLAATGWLQMAPGDAPLFGLGVFAGIVSWFAIVIGLVKRYGRHFPRNAVRVTIRTLGAALVIAAAVFAFRGAGMLFAESAVQSAPSSMESSPGTPPSP